MSDLIKFKRFVRLALLRSTVVHGYIFISSYFQFRKKKFYGNYFLTKNYIYMKR